MGCFKRMEVKPFDELEELENYDSRWCWRKYDSAISNNSAGAASYHVPSLTNILSIKKLYWKKLILLYKDCMK
jgi:hypothetical protein